MNTNKSNKIEDLLKAEFSNAVSPSADFTQELKSKLLNNFISSSKMEDDKNSKSKRFFSKLMAKPIYLAGAGACFLALVAFIGGLGYYYLNLRSQSSAPEAFGELTVFQGKATIHRGDDEIDVKAKEEEELEEGDVITTEDETIADADTIYGRVSISSNSEVELEDEDGNVAFAVGEVYARAFEDAEIVLGTPYGDVKVDDGATLSSVEAGSTESNDEGQEKNSENESAEDNGQTTVQSIAGKVTASVENQGTTASQKVDNGMQVILKNGEISDPSELDRENLKSVFCEHNTEKDDEEGYDKGTADDLVPPEITVIQPEDGMSTDQGKITVTAKSNEDGWARYNNTWNSIKANEEFSYEVSLKAGDNAVEVKVKDKSYNIATKIVNVNYNVPYSLSLDAVVSKSNGIYVKWSASGLQPGYKYQVKRTLEYKQQVGDPIVLEVAADAAVKEWTDTNVVAGKAYYYYVILLDGDGKELAITPSKGVTYSPPTTPPPSGSCSVGLSIVSTWTSQLSGRGSQMVSYLNGNSRISIVSGGNIKVSWSISGDCGEYNGVKVVWRQTPNPVYDVPPYHYITSGNVDTITGLSAGTWYIRVGTYNGSVTHYSNQVSHTF